MTDPHEKLAERYRSAKEYGELIASPGWLRLKEHLLKEVETIMSTATGAGYPTQEEEHAKILEAKAKRSVISYAESQSSKISGAMKQLDDAGIAYDAPAQA